MHFVRFEGRDLKYENPSNRQESTPEVETHMASINLDKIEGWDEYPHTTSGYTLINFYTKKGEMTWFVTDDVLKGIFAQIRNINPSSALQEVT